MDLDHPADVCRYCKAPVVPGLPPAECGSCQRLKGLWQNLGSDPRDLAPAQEGRVIHVDFTARKRR